MNLVEAKEILSNHISPLKKSNYSELRKYLRSEQYSTREFTGRSGKNYRIDIQASWADKNGGDLKIRVSIDSGGLSYFFPLTEEFKLTRYSGIVGDKKTVPSTGFRLPRWVLNATRSLREFDFEPAQVFKSFVILISIIGAVFFIGYISSLYTPHGEGEEYAYRSGAKHGLYVPIFTFRKAHSRWPLNVVEFQDFITKNKLDINLALYQKLVFLRNEDDSLTVTYSFSAVAGVRNGTFKLSAP